MELENIFWWVLSFAVVAPFLAFMFPALIGGSEALIVRSGSMEPAIPTGSMIVVGDVNTSRIQPGDVITFRNGHETGIPYTTHRVVEVDDGPVRRFRTKGDANEDPDPGWVRETEIHGKVIASVPYAGYAVSWAQTSKGLLMLVLIPATLIIVNEAGKIYLEYRPGDEETVENLSTPLRLAAAFTVTAVAVQALVATGKMDLSPVKAGAGATVLLLVLAFYLELEGHISS